MPQGLSDQFEPVEHLNRRQHMRRIGALTAPWLDQARLLERRQQRLEQHRLGTRSDEARAELAQDRRIETGVLQLQAEGVFPVDAPAHRVGGLAIRQPFRELEDRHQGELRRGDRRLAVLGEEGGELRVAVDRPERVVDPQISIPLREGGARHARGVLRQTIHDRRAQRHERPPSTTRQHSTPLPAGYYPTIVNALPRSGQVRQQHLS